ncbi:helix-turn-helix transcriptional regulator [Embleya scabrispora]|uniref:helix-turn-helix transcriptional regulator n=1 Tax=Embleya scabrispora TaxID=159449 RepID=UPI001319FD10|nr:AraC family transcriptional regulator [Embleya scabrispora]MYS82068.1 helix-turn-helix domain-containing protein [Streptomyces sp. SID5474]
MSVSRPTGLRAGFHAQLSQSASGVRHAGEQWVPARFLIHEHTHPEWEVYLQVHGLSRWTAAGRRYVLGPGHMFMVAPGTVHHMAEEHPGNHHFYFAAIDTAAVFGRHPALTEQWRNLPAVVHRPGAQSLAEPFAQLVRELTVKRSHQDEGVALAADRLILEAGRLLMPVPGTSELSIHPAVARIRTLLDGEFSRRWPLADLAERVGLAPTYLAGLFARETGMSPHRYLNERRIERARQLLAASDLTITAIGIEIGFGSGQHFARAFRQADGCTPQEYRRKGQA